jgi:uncharacterized protein (DUF2147 family)
MIKALVVSVLLISSTALAQATDVVGKWKTIDDVSGKAKSIVEIFRVGEEVKGKILKIIDPAQSSKKCDKCEGDKKDQPVQGMEIMWGLKKSDDNEWSGGHVLDPKNGKTYKARIRLKEAGQKLELRGYIGISLLGRTQTWEREKE